MFAFYRCTALKELGHGNPRRRRARVELAHHYCDPEAIQQARCRHAAALSWQAVDYLPMVMGIDVPELHELPTYNWHEQWYDPAKSFVEQMKGAIRGGASHADVIPAVRADLGVIIVPSLFGTEFLVPEHTKPVATAFPADEFLQDVHCAG